jgi:hypothetical protein
LSLELRRWPGMVEDGARQRAVEQGRIFSEKNSVPQSGRCHTGFLVR